MRVMMRVPPRGDARRPLHLAIRTTRLMGVVLLLFGTYGVSMILLAITRGGGGGPGIAESWTVFAGSLLYLVTGALFLLFSIFLGRRQHWAVVCALVLSCLMGVVLLIGLVGFFFALMQRSENQEVWMAIPLAIIALFALATGQSIYHLSRSFEAIKHPPFGEEIRGFEPLPVRPVAPTPGVDPPSASGP